MEILNEKLRRELREGQPISLELGSGGKPRAGFYGLDHLALPGVDMVADLNQPLSLLPDNSVQHLYSRHAFEHIENFLPLMREIRRVTRPGGTVEIVVPHFSNPYFYSDPTHVRFFGLFSMNYFVNPENQPALRKVPAFYSDVRFFVDAIRIEFYFEGFWDRLLAPIFDRWVNRSFYWQNFYERRLCRYFHASQIRYRMRPDKN